MKENLTELYINQLIAALANVSYDLTERQKMRHYSNKEKLIRVSLRRIIQEVQDVIIETFKDEEKE